MAMTSRVHWGHADYLLRSAIDDGTIPGVVAAAGVGSDVAWQFAGGQAVAHGGAARTIKSDTWFDVASLTKVVATLPSVLLLASRGQLTLTDTVRQHFPEWDARWERVTLRHLLTHSGGLPSTRPYFRTLVGPDAYLRAIQEEAWDGPPGTRVSYSDLGFIVLGAIVEHAAGQPMDRFVEEEVFAPLGIEAQYRPAADLRDQCAATEVDDGRALIGVVHDENARAIGGVAGHAGLFATLDGIIRYAMAWTSDDQRLFSSAVRAAAMRSYTEGLNGRRGLGWSLPGDSYDVGGDFWPATGGGHTGFTGTSLQVDPESGIWAVLLTNRVHYGRGFNINPLRRAFHNVVVQCLG